MTHLAVEAELVVDAQNGVGESPVWVAAEQALYWVDIPACTLNRWDAASGQTRHWRAPEMLACIAPAGAGRWVAGMQTGVFSLAAWPEGALAATAVSRAARVANPAEVVAGQALRSSAIRATTAASRAFATVAARSSPTAANLAARVARPASALRSSRWPDAQQNACTRQLAGRHPRLPTSSATGSQVRSTVSARWWLTRPAWSTSSR